MGVLDDAIREHLELKRQHGAGEDEIAKAEAEALGPARREPPVDPYAVEATDQELGGEPPPPPPPPPPDVEGPIEPADDLPVAYEEVPGPDAHPPLPDEPVEGAAPEPAHPDLDVGPAPEAADLPPDPDPEPHAMEPSRPHGDPLLDEGEEFAPDPDEVPAEERLAQDEPRPSDPHRATTTVLDNPLGDPPGEPPQSSEDVLEETPDFLQETPEHDRLWFEQKPPRDFDLDD